MPLPRRTLTVTFQRSVTGGIPATMEVVVVPLSTPQSPAVDASVVGGPQRQLVVLDDDAVVVFQLVPTDHPDLDQRVLYRIAWRERFLGRQYTHDFVMPDSDVAFADLDDLGAVLGGTTYVQWTDRGVPGGVAALDEQGRVLDADGVPVIGVEQALSENSFTASQGVLKVSDDTGEVPVYDFRLDPNLAARRWVGPVIPASGSFGVVDHGLGTVFVSVSVYETATRMPVAVTARPNLDGDTVAIEFAAPPPANLYTAVVIG